MIARSRFGLLCVIAMAVVSLFAMASSAAFAGTIEGEVIDSGSKVGIAEVEVCAWESGEFEPSGCVKTDEDGEYALAGLADGGYRVEFWAPYLGYATQFYDGVASFEDAEEVIVGGSPVTGIDAEMEEGGKIEGRVTDALTGAGIKGIEVCVFASDLEGACSSTNFFGSYSIGSLATGTYQVVFFDELGEYEALFYNQQTGLDAANPVGVVAPVATTGIDARLSKPGLHDLPPITLGAPPDTFLPKTISKTVKCRKGFKKVKRHGHKVCVRKHKKKKKHRS